MVLGRCRLKVEGVQSFLAKRLGLVKSSISWNGSSQPTSHLISLIYIVSKGKNAPFPHPSLPVIGVKVGTRRDSWTYSFLEPVLIKLCEHFVGRGNA